ncbi:MAG: hypothetical protein KGN76_06025 [Acidobacteriota bacterium]|nr:hypothetical protein [Acidobacteriota bacterium]
MTSCTQISRIAQAILARAGLPYELVGVQPPTDRWGIWELTFLDPDAPRWARTFHLPLEWEAGTTGETAAAALEDLLRDHRSSARP